MTASVGLKLRRFVVQKQMSKPCARRSLAIKGVASSPSIDKDTLIQDNTFTK